MAKIIALYGRGNSGKTETIVNVAKKLFSKYSGARYTGTQPQGFNFNINTLNKGEDLRVLFTQINGMVVGIESQGDPNSRLENSLKFFVSKKCDIIICACRTRGMTIDWIKAY